LGVQDSTPSPLEGEGRGGGPVKVPVLPIVAQCPKDSFQHDIGVAQHVARPEPNYAIAARFEPLGSNLVVRQLKRVLPAVDFDDEATFGTEEVDDITTDRSLPAEPVSRERTAAQSGPEPNLGVAWTLSELAGAFDVHGPRV